MTEITISSNGTETLIAYECDFCGREFPVNEDGYAEGWKGDCDNRQACHDCWESR